MCREPEYPEAVREMLAEWYANGWIVERDPDAPEPSWSDMRMPEGD